MTRSSGRRALGAAVCFGALLLAGSAWGQIKRPGSHIDYTFEAEPHLLLGPLAPFDDDDDIGFGFRGSIELVDNGFISTINNTVGIGFGIDHQNHTDRIPVVMQWNFWLHRKFSVFGEPGVAFRLRHDRGNDFDPFVFYAGGRWHFTDWGSLTFRIGHPVASLGVSFFL
ncbi:MAG: hypothetical protein KC766_30005 [Myxococcales bacterium]|nr:hypothetical protein [Myxococcales bacterium]